jgi:hypothetical protein
MVGDGNIGTGVWVDINNNAFEGYIGNLCSTNIIYCNNNSEDAAKALSYMVAGMQVRMMATSGLTVGKGVVLDNNTITELSNGGDTFCGHQIAGTKSCSGWKELRERLRTTFRKL